jgi:hypothetical protein
MSLLAGKFASNMHMAKSIRRCILGIWQHLNLDSGSSPAILRHAKIHSNIGFIGGISPSIHRSQKAQCAHRRTIVRLGCYKLSYLDSIRQFSVLTPQGGAITLVCQQFVLGRDLCAAPLGWRSQLPQ